MILFVLVILVMSCSFWQQHQQQQVSSHGNLVKGTTHVNGNTSDGCQGCCPWQQCQWHILQQWHQGYYKCNSIEGTTQGYGEKLVEKQGGRLRWTEHMFIDLKVVIY